MRRQKGFSLIELLIVVGIILVLAAIVIPSLIRARISANEAAAAAGTRTLVTAQYQYQMAFPSIGFAPNLASLGGSSCATPSPTSACLIDPVLANATSRPKQGYYYGGTGDQMKFSVGNYPSMLGFTGNTSFCAAENGVLWGDPTGTNNSTTCPTSGDGQSLSH